MSPKVCNMLRNKSHLLRRNGYYILRLKKADADAALLFLAFWFSSAKGTNSAHCSANCSQRSAAERQLVPARAVRRAGGLVDLRVRARFHPAEQGQHRHAHQ